MDEITVFHNRLVYIIAAISVFVLILLLVIISASARANPTPSRTTHNTLLEIAWTVVPVLILVASRCHRSVCCYTSSMNRPTSP